MTDYISIMDYRDTADGSAGIIAQAHMRSTTRTRSENLTR